MRIRYPFKISDSIVSDRLAFPLERHKFNALRSSAIPCRDDAAVEDHAVGDPNGFVIISPTRHHGLKRKLHHQFVSIFQQEPLSLYDKLSRSSSCVTKE